MAAKRTSKAGRSSDVKTVSWITPASPPVKSVTSRIRGQRVIHGWRRSSDDDADPDEVEDREDDEDD